MPVGKSPEDSAVGKADTFSEKPHPYILLFFFGIASIPVVISVLVAVASATTIRTVQNDRHVPVFLVGVELLNLRQHAPVEQTGTDDEEGDIRQHVDDGGIGHDFHRMGSR